MKKKKLPPTEAFHASNSDGSKHVVGIGNLRVLISQDGSLWFAQGLEIDYFAEGVSLKDVQNSFENGLSSTIREHLKLYGTIDKLLKVAPAEIWLEFYRAKTCHVHSQVSEHKLLFEGIDYYELAAAA